MQSKLTMWCLIVALIIWSSNLTFQLESRGALEQLNNRFVDFSLHWYQIQAPPTEPGTAGWRS